MPDTKYLRRLMIGAALLLAWLVISPLSVIGGVRLACRTTSADGCGDVAVVFIMFGVLPALTAILVYIAWAVFRRLSFLKLSVWYMVLVGLLITGNIQAILFAPGELASGHLHWQTFVPPLLSLMVILALYWIPNQGQRTSVPQPIYVAFIVVSVLLIARIADVVFYPLWLFPGGLEISFAIKRLAYFGALGFVPDLVVVLSFVALFLLIVAYWRRSERTTTA